MLAQVYTTSTREDEAGDCKFKASLSHIASCRTASLYDARLLNNRTVGRPAGQW